MLLRESEVGFLIGSQISSSLFELNWVPALGAADAALAAVPLPVHVAGRRRPEIVQLLRVELKGKVEQCLSVPTESGSLQVLLHLQDQKQKQNYTALLQNYSALLLLQVLLVLLLLLWLQMLLLPQVLLLLHIF